MHIPLFRKKIEICSPNDALPCCEKADSEFEWVRTMRSLKKKHGRTSRRMSFDNESLVKPCFDNLNETDDQFNMCVSAKGQILCCKRPFSSTRRLRDDEIRLPSQINFGLSFIEDIDLRKREIMNVGVCGTQNISKPYKTLNTCDEVVSECDKKRSHAETKPFNSVHIYSSENSSVDSNNSGASNLKIGKRIVLFDNGEHGLMIRYPNLNSLYRLLKKHFKCQELTKKDTHLLPHELHILRSIIKRKYKNKINFNIENLFLKDKLNQICLLNSNKRPEENYKFIFKRCLKYMKDEFKNTFRQRCKKENIDRAFYAHYFQEIADKEGINLESFYHPRNSKSKCKNLPKTINSDYIENICKSKEFISKFLAYAFNRLKVEYEEVIDTKIEGLIKKWDALFYSNKPKSEIIAEVTAYIETNKKCKLPWNFSEIHEAVASLNKLFKGYLDK